jgi:hypothetical protein
MKGLGQLSACGLLCLLLCSCSPETDFRISRETAEQEDTVSADKKGIFVIINKNSLKYHSDFDCVYASRIATENRLEILVSDEDFLKERGYSACLKCEEENK